MNFTDAVTWCLEHRWSYLYSLDGSGELRLSIPETGWPIIILEARALGDKEWGRVPICAFDVALEWRDE